jgi:hypothetical protein
MTLIASGRPVLYSSTLDRLRARRLSVPPRVDLANFNPERFPLLTDDRNPIRVLRRSTARAWRAACLRSESGRGGRR